MRLTKQTAYAIRILTHCARESGRTVKTAEIAKRHQITEHNVAKVVPLLVQGGFLASARGRSGGIRLAKPAAEIRLGDVVRSIEQTHFRVDASREGEGDGGLIDPLLDEALAAFIAVLDQHTLQDLVGADGPEEAPLHRRAAGEARRLTR